MNGNVQKAVILIVLLLGGVLSVFLINDNDMVTLSKQNTEYNATVCINGRDKHLGALITEEDNESIIVVPLIQTLSSLGVEVQWEESNTAILRYKAKKYEVDLERISFVPLYDMSSDNLLLPPPGSSYRNRVANRDILIDYGLFSYIANYMEINIISVNIDNTSQCLTIILED